MFITKAIFYLGAAFLGYAIGRTGHVLGGTLPTPHHWIYGLGLVVLGLFFKDKFWGAHIIFFGIGLFISDLNDFLHLRFYGEDVVKTFKFWGFD